MFRGTGAVYFFFFFSYGSFYSVVFVSLVDFVSWRDSAVIVALLGMSILVLC